MDKLVIFLIWVVAPLVFLFLLGWGEDVNQRKWEEIRRKLHEEHRQAVLKYNHTFGKAFPWLTHEVPKYEKPEGEKGRNIWGFLFGR